VQIGRSPVEEERVRFPQIIKHRNTWTEFGDVTDWSETESLVLPRLTEVTIDGKCLKKDQKMFLLKRDNITSSKYKNQSEHLKNSYHAINYCIYFYTLWEMKT